MASDNLDARENELLKEKDDILETYSDYQTSGDGRLSEIEQEIRDIRWKRQQT